VGYWRWRHLCDSPGLKAMPARPQTVFRVPVSGRAIDLREPPFVQPGTVPGDSPLPCWTHRSDYTDCQSIARTAREAGLQLVRYESVRDSRHGGCGAVLDAAAFAAREPVEQQGWILTVMQARVVWQRSDPLNPGVLEFSAAGWQ
jgi:hypothetical protein